MARNEQEAKLEAELEAKIRMEARADPSFRQRDGSIAGAGERLAQMIGELEKLLALLQADLEPILRADDGPKDTRTEGATAGARVHSAVAHNLFSMVDGLSEIMNRLARLRGRIDL